MKIILTLRCVLLFTVFMITSLQAQTVPDSVKTETVQDSTKKERSFKLLLDQIEIQGWLEKPQMVYVIPGLNPAIDDIILERSFLVEILRPLQKDRFEKQKILRRKRTVIPW